MAAEIAVPAIVRVDATKGIFGALNFHTVWLPPAVRTRVENLLEAHAGTVVSGIKRSVDVIVTESTQVKKYRKYALGGTSLLDCS